MEQKFEAVDKYIDLFPKNTQSILKKIRQTIQQVVPAKTEQVISYGIPTFKLKSKYVIYFAGFAQHVSVYPIPKGDDAYQKAITPFVAGRGTLKFPLGKPIPYDIIEQTARHLLQEHAERNGQ